MTPIGRGGDFGALAMGGDAEKEVKKRCF